MSSGEDIEARRRVAEGLLKGDRLTEDWGGFAACPGEGRHTGKTGVKDFRVILSGAPTGHCVHRSCAEDVDAWNLELRRQVWREEHGGAQSNGTRGKRSGEVDDMRNVAAMPKEEQRKIYPVNLVAVGDFVKGVPKVDKDWLRQRSPVDVATCGLVNFFGALYREGERALIFTRFTSQGDFAWWQGKGSFRLGQEKGVKAVPSELPGGAKCGVWFLVNPVDLQWHEVKMMQKEGRKISRRSEPAVTSFRYMVLETDDLEDGVWLQVLAALKLPIVAIVTSGGRGPHAIVRVDQDSKADWDHLRVEVMPLLSSLGADPAAIRAVQLSRLPFMIRRGKQLKDGTYLQFDRPAKQELLWLDPDADGGGLLNKPARRI